ncbi:MAG: family transcriptional regulator [Eubacterium sp.]|nr:family transcriptional regulator [Eubacterium sp.]
MKNISGNSLVIKEVNINLVRKVLKEKGQATKQQIAQATGLSTVTVNTVLIKLIQQNEAYEIELSSSIGGRRAHQFRYNSNHALALILFPYENKGEITVHSTVINLSGECVEEGTVIVNTIDLSVLENIIAERLSAYQNIKAMGFGLPGAENEGKMVVSDYKALLGVSITEYFSKKYNKPVIVENDVNAAVIGYSKRSYADDGSTVVYLYFPENYPPGAGISINGKLHKGKRNFAGEVSNIPLGIPWGDAAFYSSFDEVCKAIGNIVISVSSIIDPDLVVMHGNFLTPLHSSSIAEICRNRLPHSVVPEIVISCDFTQDYLKGMIVKTLETLEPNIALTEIKY